MGAMISKFEVRKHYMIAIDWKASLYTLEAITEQYGSWLRADEQRIYLGAKSVMRHIYEMANGCQSRRNGRAIPRCRISDVEGFAVMDLLDDMAETDNEVVSEWLKCYILHYVHFREQEQIAQMLNIGRNTVATNIKCAIAHITAKRPSINAHYLKYRSLYH